MRDMFLSRQLLLYLACFTLVAPVASLLKQYSTDPLCFRQLLPFVGPESALTVSSNSFAYWLFHAITFEREVFSKIHESKSKKSLKCTCEQVQTNAEAARAVTDGQIHTHTHTHTHATTTVTLAHARRGYTGACVRTREQSSHRTSTNHCDTLGRRPTGSFE